MSDFDAPNSRKVSTAGQYVRAFAAVAFCTCVAIAFRPFTTEAPFLIFLPAVFYSLAIGGFPVALFASVLSACSADFFLFPPLYSFYQKPQDLVKETFFVVIMAGTAWLFQRQRNRSEQFFRLQHALLDTADASIMMTDRQHHLIYWNKGAERLYGWTEAEAIGKVPKEFLATNYPVPMEEIDCQLEETGRWQGQLHRKCKDGHYVETASSWANDKKTGYTLQTAVDVTALNLARSELARANRALSALSKVNQLLLHSPEEDKLLQQAVEIIAESGGYPLAWIAIPMDDPGRTVKIGASAGKSVDYISKLNMTWNDEPAGRGPTGTALREGKPSVNHDFLTYPDCAPWRELAMQYGFRSSICLPLIVEGKTIAGLTLYAAEENAFEERELALVSELAANLAFGWGALRLREQAEEERKSHLLLEAQLLQSQKMEAIGRLAGGISHDFNNLLMIIMAQTELLSMELEGPALARAAGIMSSAMRAAELTRQLLAFSRKQIVELKTLSLNPILLEITEMASHLVGEDIEIATGLCADPWPVLVDRSQIEQVIMNLVVNARDAMPGGGKLTIEAQNVDITTEYIATHPLMPAGRYVMMAVSDTGVGMEETTRAHMFEPFFTTKEPGKGTGLGLSMVYGIVKQSHGFVWCYSELGKGTCFKIYLPAAEPSAAAAESPVTSASTPALDHATILLVEDEPTLRNVIIDFLASAGHTVIAAESHEEAMERAAESGSAIDLLLTDVILKGRNGKQLAESLKAKGFHFKVIYMSGYTPDAIVHHGVLEEGTIFLQKPFSRATLLAKIQETLTHSGVS
jgi:PAS domain S-box-containing protein